MSAAGNRVFQVSVSIHFILAILSSDLHLQHIFFYETTVLLVYLAPHDAACETNTDGFSFIENIYLVYGLIKVVYDLFFCFGEERNAMLFLCGSTIGIYSLSLNSPVNMNLIYVWR